MLIVAALEKCNWYIEENNMYLCVRSLYEPPNLNSIITYSQHKIPYELVQYTVLFIWHNQELDEIYSIIKIDVIYKFEIFKESKKLEMVYFY